MRQFFWRAVQIAIFAFMLYAVHEWAEAEMPGETSVLSHVVIAVALTLLAVAPFILFEHLMRRLVGRARQKRIDRRPLVHE